MDSHVRGERVLQASRPCFGDLSCIELYKESCVSKQLFCRQVHSKVRSILAYTHEVKSSKSASREQFTYIDTHGRRTEGLHCMKGAMTHTVSANRTTAWRNCSLRHKSSPSITRLLIRAIK